MEEVANFISEIKSRTNIEISDVYIILNNLNKKIRNVLIDRISKLEIHKEYKGLINLLIANWAYPIKWEIRSTPIVSTAINENKDYYVKLDVRHQLFVFSDVREIDLSISSLVDNIKSVCNEKLAKCSERILLNKLHDLYKNLSNDDGDDLKKIITKCFHAKYVNCENNYANREYFDSYESDVPIEETRFCSMVSTIDDSCIEKGVYLYPSQK